MSNTSFSNVYGSAGSLRTYGPQSLLSMPSPCGSCGSPLTSVRHLCATSIPHTYFTATERLTAEFREEAEAREEAEQRQDPDFTQNSKRKAILDLLRPYILVSTRYPSFHAPDNHFNFPLHPATQDQLPFSLLTPHGIWPLYRRPENVVTHIPHFTGTIALSHPLITVAAKLLYLARREAQPIQVPPTLIVDRPTALAQGRTGVFPTQADIIEFNRYRGSQFVDKGNWDQWKDGLTLEELHAEASSIWLPTLKCLSSKWDPDWTRLIGCIDPWDNSPFKRAVHMYGVLDGLWHGRMLMPDEGSYFRIANTVSLPTEFGESFPFVTTVPVMVRLREHHCIRPAKAVDVPEGDEPDELFDEGVRNGWLPGGTKFREDGVSSPYIHSFHILTFPKAQARGSRSTWPHPCHL